MNENGERQTLIKATAKAIVDTAHEKGLTYSEFLMAERVADDAVFKVLEAAGRTHDGPIPFVMV